ncbi:MAG: Rrf2 family transcriptional regulator [Acidimicrobiia bacterium]|nr:MAG: Rrf2 family transcriptional regulator [Acidimicrobiia bacterium]
MAKMSEGVEWAIHLCMLLAIAPPESSISSKRLASFHELPAAYLAKHLQALSSAGIVEALPGRSGGYRLARDAESISFLDIVDAIESDEAWFRCGEIRQCGPSAQGPGAYSLPCEIAATMWAAERAWRDHLASVNLYTATEGLTAIAGPAQHTATLQWLGDETGISPQVRVSDT